MDEEWRDVAGYEGLYKVSSLGRVYSVPRLSANGSRVGNRVLSPNRHKNGYLSVMLSKDGRANRALVHRLVARAFLGVDDERTEVNHIDGRKDNNAVSNLEWCNHSENNAHAVRIGLRTMDKVTKGCIEKRRRPVALFFEGREVAWFPSVKDAASLTGIGETCIARCARGEVASCGGYRAEYCEAPPAGGYA